MNLTTKQLKQTIKEELEKVISENDELKQKILNLLNSNEIKNIKQGLMFNKTLKAIPEDEVADMLISKIYNLDSFHPLQKSFLHWQDDGLAWFLLEKFPNHKSFKKIKVLDLTYGNVSTLPESIQALENLVNLKLRDTQISKLPDGIVNLKKLATLDLTGSSLSALPEDIGKLANLETLWLRGTPVSKLPESIGNLKNLKSLNLRNTQLSSLPESVGGLESLEFLHLNNTPISKLPESIRNLKNLRALDLRRAKLLRKDIPENLRKITRI